MQYQCQPFLGPNASLRTSTGKLLNTSSSLQSVVGLRGDTIPAEEVSKYQTAIMLMMKNRSFRAGLSKVTRSTQHRNQRSQLQFTKHLSLNSNLRSPTQQTHSLQILPQGLQ